MSSVTDLINSSFRLIGAIAAGETLETNELNDALVSLNQMIDVWNTEGVSVVGRQQAIMGLSGTNGPYPLSTRPVRIESASVSSSGIDSPLELVDSIGWEAIPEKAMQSVYVKKLFCDYQYPASNVWIWPIPRLGGRLETWYYQILPEFASLTDTVNMPPGYEIAVRYNFAVALLPEYPRSAADPSLPAQAQMYKASLMQLNSQNHMRSQSPSPTQAAVADAAEAAAR